MADEIADQDHFRAAVAPRFGRVADGFDIAFVKMLQAS